MILDAVAVVIRISLCSSEGIGMMMTLITHAAIVDMETDSQALFSTSLAEINIADTLR